MDRNAFINSITEEKNRKKIIELIDKLEKPYNELHAILDEMQEYWEVSSPACSASDLLSVMMEIIVNQVEKKVRPNL